MKEGPGAGAGQEAREEPRGWTEKPRRACRCGADPAAELPGGGLEKAGSQAGVNGAGAPV